MTSFIQKLGLGLKKSSQKISNGLSDIFTKKKLSSDTLDDLSDVLLSADMGTTATQKIISPRKNSPPTRWMTCPTFC